MAVTERAHNGKSAMGSIEPRSDLKKNGVIAVCDELRPLLADVFAVIDRRHGELLSLRDVAAEVGAHRRAMTVGLTGRVERARLAQQNLVRLPSLEAAYRSLVAGYHFPQIERITVSVGFTRVCEDDTPTDAFDRADQAVYWVKQNGRNQVISHDQLVQGGHLASKEVKGGIDFF